MLVLLENREYYICVCVCVTDHTDESAKIVIIWITVNQCN